MFILFYYIGGVSNDKGDPCAGFMLGLSPNPPTNIESPEMAKCSSLNSIGATLGQEKWGELVYPSRA